MFIQRGKTNWKFLLTVIILAAVVAELILIWQQNILPQFKIFVTPTPTSTPTSTPDETANWKTYQIEEMRFSIKSPSDFEYFEPLAPDFNAFRDGLICTFLERDISLTIDIFSWTEFNEELLGERYTLEDWIASDTALPPGISNPQLLRENIIVDNNPAIRISYILTYLTFPSYYKKIITVYTQKGKRMYNISGMIEDPEKEKISLPIFNQMLSTFRFLE